MRRRDKLAVPAILVAVVSICVAAASPEPGASLSVDEVSYIAEVPMGSAGFKIPMADPPEIHLENSEEFSLTMTNGPAPSGYIWIEVEGLPWARSLLASRGGGPALVDDAFEVVGSLHPPDPNAIAFQQATPAGTAALWVRFDPMEADEQTDFVWQVEFVSGPEELPTALSVYTGGPAFGPDGPEAAALVWEGTAPVLVVDEAVDG